MRLNIIGTTTHWANTVRKTLRDILARYTNTNEEESILRQCGRWFLTDIPISNGIRNFNDCTIAINEGESKISLKQVEKSSMNEKTRVDVVIAIRMDVNHCK